MGQRQNLSRIEPMAFRTLVRCSNHLAAKDSWQAGPYKHNLKIYDLYLFIYLFIYLFNSAQLPFCFQNGDWRLKGLNVRGFEILKWPIATLFCLLFM